MPLHLTQKCLSKYIGIRSCEEGEGKEENNILMLLKNILFKVDKTTILKIIALSLTELSGSSLYLDLPSVSTLMFSLQLCCQNLNSNLCEGAAVTREGCSSHTVGFN